MEWHKQQSSIMTDSLSGSADITDATAQMLLRLLQEETNISTTQLTSLLQQNSHEIITAQSGMAALVNLYNRVFSAIDHQHNAVQNIKRLTSTVNNFEGLFKGANLSVRSASDIKNLAKAVSQEIQKNKVSAARGRGNVR